MANGASRLAGLAAVVITSARPPGAPGAVRRATSSATSRLLPVPAAPVISVFASGFARGVSTGLGVLNVWSGFWEAIQYREE